MSYCVVLRCLLSDFRAIAVYMQPYLLGTADFHPAHGSITTVVTGPNQRSDAVSLRITAVQQFKINYLWWFTIDWNGNCERGLEKKKEWQMTKDKLRVKALWEVQVFGVAPLGKKQLNNCCQRERDVRRPSYFLSVCLSVWLSISASVRVSGCLLVYLVVCLSPFLWLSSSNLTHLSAAGTTVN